MRDISLHVQIFIRDIKMSFKKFELGKNSYFDWRKNIEKNLNRFGFKNKMRKEKTINKYIIWVWRLNESFWHAINNNKAQRSLFYGYYDFKFV